MPARLGPRTPSWGMVKPVTPSLASQAVVSAAVTHSYAAQPLPRRSAFGLLSGNVGSGPREQTNETARGIGFEILEYYRKDSMSRISSAMECRTDDDVSIAWPIA